VVERVELSGYRGQPGGVIAVIATDDLEVVSVGVAIHTQSGGVVERGAAAKTHGVWRYAATATAPAGEPLTIVVTATDRPGHEGSRTVSYPQIG
jgi:hypothetical protein